MSSRFFIAVGGSGQHVALALTRLVYMGALKNDIQLIAIDPDNKEALSQTLQSPAGMSGTRHPLKQGQVHTPFDVSKYGEKTFAQMFVDDHNPDERDLFESMFSVEMDSIPVHKGMYGTPCVGATVFAEGAQNASFTNNLSPVQNATDVFVCGSVVGGTGAGITHKLIKEIRTRYLEPKPMYGVFMLPWFKVQSGVETKGTVTNAIIQRNSTHGIKYFYEHTIPALTSSVLVGYPDNFQSQVLNTLLVGPGDMGQERPHFLHLAASHGLAKLHSGGVANRDMKAYYVSHPREKEDWLLDETWEDGACLVGEGAAHRDDQAPRGLSLRARIRGHQVLLNLLTFLTEDKQRQEFLDFYKTKTFLGVNFNVVASRAWGDNLHASIVNAEPNEETRRTFVDEMLKELSQIREEVLFCVDWAQKLFRPEMLRFPRDELLDRLNRGEQWKILQAIWAGRPAIAPAVKPAQISPAQIARSHAKFILDAALKV